MSRGRDAQSRVHFLYPFLRLTRLNPALNDLKRVRLTTLDDSPNHYDLLSVPHSASPTEIKLAYHRALLLHHPDKHPTGRTQTPVSAVDIARIKEAYTTLSSPSLRAEYDAMILKKSVDSRGPRPAQVVSLEEFLEPEETEAQVWSYGCRCGGEYKIAEEEMERGDHLVGCNSCSEVIWVGYEFVTDGGGGGEGKPRFESHKLGGLQAQTNQSRVSSNFSERERNN